jgi:hypothetical protein
MKVIPETCAVSSNSTMSVPDEGYSRNMIVSSNSTMSVPDEGYSRNMSGIFKLYYERT